MLPPSFFGQKEAGFGQRSRLPWPKKTRLTPAQPASAQKKPAYTGQKPASFWPESRLPSARSRLTPAYAGFLLPEQKPAYTGLRRLPWPKKKPAYAGLRRLLRPEEAGFLWLKKPAYTGQRSRLWPKKPASSRCSLLHRPPSRRELVPSVLLLRRELVPSVLL